jgi:hypothetical protein
VRLLDAPVERRDDPRARAYIVDHLNPGDSIARRIEVSNTTSEPLQIQLYAAGARLEEGSFIFFNGREGNELTGWTRLEPAVVTVPPDGAAVSTVHLDVPSDATEGERYAVVWAEPPPSSGGNVAVVNRVGIRVYLSVGPGGEPASRFALTQLRAARDEQAAPQVVATVENTGGRALDLRGVLNLTGGPGGISAGPFETPGTTTVGVNEDGDVVFSLDPALPAGPWEAKVTLQSGRTEASAEATITFPDAGETTSAPDRALAPWWIAVAVGVLIGILLLLFLLARRRRARERQAVSAGPGERPDEPRATVGDEGSP